MSGYGTDDHSSEGIIRSSVHGQASITARLNKTIATMHHIAEVFQWLSHVIVRTYDIQVTQWWEFEPALTNQYTLRLLGMICQDTSIPQYILANDRLANMVEQLSFSPSGFLQAGVDRLCTHYQATLLARYGLHYCSWRSLNNPALLLPRTTSEQGSAIPLNITLLLLQREAVPGNVLAAINHILDQSISIATTYNLLTSVTPLVSTIQTSPSVPVTPAILQTPQPTTGPLVPQIQPDATQSAGPVSTTPQATRLDLVQLIPRPLEQSVGGLLTIKPVIADKQAHRVFEAIDGRKTIKEIQIELHMDMRAIAHAVQFLLMQRRIQLYEPNGQLVESSQFLNDI